ncbi:MAG: hypothetical protein KC422_13670 [Trueperaceae bacterium]|nr:hypothetical protein [Trueperaceae bacterium]
MKRFLLLILMVLFSVVWAQSSLPDDARFDTPVSLVTQSEGELLQAMIESLALSVGLTPIADGVPEQIVNLRIEEPKPFRQLWDILLQRYNLDFALLENDVIVVGSSANVAEFKPQPVAEPNTTEPVVQEFYRIQEGIDVEQIAELIRRIVPDVVIEALPGLQSVLVRGSQAQQNQVALIVKQYNPIVDQINRELRVYPLSNASAEELATVLQGSGVLAQAASAANAADPNAADNAQAADNAAGAAATNVFTIVADKGSNSLIVNAPADIHSRIAELITQLDVPRQQVNVQLRIQEITSEQAARLGINLTTALGNFAVNLLEGGLKFIFDAQQSVSGLNIGAVLDTLERQGLSRKVDDTNITVLNNEQANLKSGGRVEIQFQGADGSVGFRTLEYGVIVSMTPRITNDGRVIVSVEAEISDLLTPFSEGEIPNRVDFSERKTSSTVTLAPGQTVVLGGLFQNSFSQTTTGVPVLSTIPFIGNLFSQTDIQDKDTELLLIITADIIE